MTPSIITDEQIEKIPALRLRYALTLAKRGFHFAPARLGCTHGNIGWPTDATTDPEKIQGWLSDSQTQLVMVAKFGKCAALDIDDWQACLAEGFDPKWIEGMFKVMTPSGGVHVYSPWSAAFDGFKGSRKQDVHDPTGKLIAELKHDKSSVAAPYSYRSPDDKHSEGFYIPEGGKIIPCPNAPALAEWLRVHAKKKPKSEFIGHTGNWKFHPDFNTDDFLEANQCTLADGSTEGMYEGSYDVILESCPLCDEPARPNSTMTNFVTKFKFGGTGYGFKCCACDVDTRPEFEEKMAELYPDWQPWNEYIYRDEDLELLFADGEKVGFKVERLRDLNVTKSKATPMTIEELQERMTNEKPVIPPEAESTEMMPYISHPSPAILPSGALPSTEVMPSDGGEMEVGDYTDDITCTDLANGKRLARFCGNDLCFVVEFKSWYVWDGKRWAEDKGNVEVNRRAKEVAEVIFAEADNYDEEKAKAVRKWACNSCNKSRLDAMRELAISEGTIAKRAELFDQDPHLFNCQNGVIDLRSGELLPHDRKYWMMNISPVSHNPDTLCPVWLAHLDKVQRGDADMIGFLQRLAGYSLWGSSEEETANFLWGDGRNGKGKTLDTFLRILGDYATTVPFATLLDGVKRNPQGASPDLAGLSGKRMVVAQESNINGTG